MAETGLRQNGGQDFHVAIATLILGNRYLDLGKDINATLIWVMAQTSLEPLLYKVGVMLQLYSCKRSYN